MKNILRKGRGFSIIEILLVVAAITILAGIVIVAINPGKQFMEIRNTQRVSDVNKILAAINHYMVDNDGVLPENLEEEELEICQTSASDCEGLLDLSVLTNNERYLVAIPVDPQKVRGENGAGYTVRVTENGRVVVSSSYAEGGAVIEEIR